MLLQDLEVIFSNILDVHELTQNLLSSLEDTVEATEGQEVPLIGSCFEELTEVMSYPVAD
jgi:son of sevenless